MRVRLLKFAGIILLCIALLGFWGYNKYFKPDPVVQQQLNSQFGEEFFTSFEPQPEGDNKTRDREKPSENQAQITKESLQPLTQNHQQVEGTSGETTSLVNGTLPTHPITVDEIRQKYQPQFSYLQTVALSRLDTLYSTAIKEYEQAKKDGTLNRTELIQKYIQAGKTLETNVDSRFNTTLNAMKDELTANKLSIDIISVIRDEYDKVKSEKRSQLLAKAHK